MPRFLFVAFKVGDDSFQTNNHKYISLEKGENEVEIQRLQVRLNQVHYPNDYITIEPSKQNIFQAYESYKNICKITPKTLDIA